MLNLKDESVSLNQEKNQMFQLSNYVCISLIEMEPNFKSLLRN